jgi:hypothetical protein
MAIESIIFGLGYKARSGKDTAVAEIITKRSLDYDVRRYSFADALKREVNAAAVEAGGMNNLLTLGSKRFVMDNGYFKDFPDWVQYDPKAPMDDPLCPLGKQRTLLQFWGGDYRRSQDPEYWIKKLAERISEEKPEIALITDLRYLNEFEFCKEYGETIKVVRPGLPQGTHASETELDSVPDAKWSAVLTNDGSLEQFKQKSVELFEDVLTRFPQGYGV